MSQTSYTLKLGTGPGSPPDLLEFEADTLYQALAHARASVIDQDAELWRGDVKLFDLRLLQGGVWQFFPAGPAEGDAGGAGVEASPVNVTTVPL